MQRFIRSSHVAVFNRILALCNTDQRPIRNVRGSDSQTVAGHSSVAYSARSELVKRTGHPHDLLVIRELCGNSVQGVLCSQIQRLPFAVCLVCVDMPAREWRPPCSSVRLTGLLHHTRHGFPPHQPGRPVWSEKLGCRPVLQRKVLGRASQSLLTATATHISRDSLADFKSLDVRILI